MPNINTSSAFRNRDFVAKDLSVQSPEFYDLYNHVVGQLNYIATLNCDTTFNIELNKIKLKMRKLVNKYFIKSLDHLQSVELHRSMSNDYSKEIQQIVCGLKL